MKLKLSLLALASFILIGSASAAKKTTTFIVMEPRSFRELRNAVGDAQEHLTNSQKLLAQLLDEARKSGIKSSASVGLMNQYAASAIKLRDQLLEIHSHRYAFKKWQSTKLWNDVAFSKAS